MALSYAEDAELDLPVLQGELRPFQRAGVRYALARRRTFIADEQGLGKTIQALATLQADGAWPAAVVCPASMKLAWEREALSWLPERSVAVVHGRSPAGWARAGAASAELVVLNYEIVEAHLERLAARDLHAIVYDESHYCKDARRKRTKAAIELSRRLDPDALRLALTGTPVLNRPSELPSQLRLLGRLSDFGSGARLSRRFRGEDGRERLHSHLRAHCYVRRLKADARLGARLDRRLHRLRASGWWCSRTIARCSAGSASASRRPRTSSDPTTCTLAARRSTSSRLLPGRT